ncbi:MAG TPA: hypothetical protein VL172_14115 [Kofleriaceae bacterium]|jgi:hypothetical protein|nr:hypothetical protein [Kofleriaceae bacterium]
MARAAVVRSLWLLAAASCGDTAIHFPAEAPDASAISPACMEAVNHSDLDWIQDNIFSVSCARFTACHKGRATSAEGLNLEINKAAMNLIGVESKVCGLPQVLLRPGDPAGSFLMKVLDPDKYPLPDPVGPGTDCPDGDPEEPPETMPYNNPLLCVEKREAVERWIMSLGGSDAGVPDAGDIDAMPDAL